MLQDLRFALRTLLKNPGFALVAILTLALGIGATTAVFSVLNSALIRPLPYPDADRLVTLEHESRDPSVTAGLFSPPDFDDLAREGRSFERLAAYFHQPGQSGMNLTGMGDPARVRSAMVSADFFPALGVDALLGRGLLPEENVEGRDRAVVISEALWRARLGADPRVLGRTVNLDGEAFTVVGVMPRDFRFPASDVEVWVPISLIGEGDIPTQRGLRWMSVLGRLRPGVSAEAARLETNALLARLAERYPESNETLRTARVRTLRDSLVGEMRPALLVLFGAVGLVLLIACVNLANLLLARATTQQRELAVRTALGAGRGRLIRQQLTQNLVLALLGGATGVLVALWGTELLLAAARRQVSLPTEVAADWRVLAFALGAALLTGLATGLLPAWRVAAMDVQKTLREGGRSGTDAGRSQRLRGALVVTETALAVVLLVGAVLMVRSFWRLVDVDPGFSSAGVLALGITIDDSKQTPSGEKAERHLEIVERIAQLPGVLAVGGGKTLPLHGGGEPFAVQIEGREGPDATLAPSAGAMIVTSGYFRALGIPLLRGRLFPDRELGDVPPVVINQATAERYWPGQDPVGAIVRLGEARAQVVGVVGDVRHEGLAEEAGTAIYLPLAVASRSTQKVFVRTAGDPLALLPAVRGAIAEIDPTQPVYDVATLRQVVSETVARPRLLALLLALFGGVATVLAALGLYGVLAYAVGQRTREIGIRMALGARAGDVLRLVVLQALGLAALGLGVGALGALALSRTLRGLLFQVSPADPLTFAAVAALLAGVALAASLLPARRAARVDPMVALRSE